MNRRNKELILHIGTHKTGTTSIQHALKDRERELLKKDIYFFTLLPNGSNSEVVNTSGWVNGGPTKHGDLFSGEGLKIRTSADDLAEKLSDNTCSKVIMSAEGLSWIYDADEINSLHEALARHFETIRIIIYIRRQDKYVISHNQMASRSPNLPSYGYYKGGNRSLPEGREHYDEYLDYNAKILLWENAFGTDNIVVRVFSREALIGSDAVSDFFSINSLGDSYKSITKNTSNSFERTKIGHILNEFMPSCSIEKRIRKNTSNKGLLLPSSLEARNFYSMYVESNIKLNERLNISETNRDIFGLDFSSYPESSKDLWDEESANTAIQNIFKAIQPYSLIEINDLRDAAIALERTNMELSYRLMSVALALRPNGPGIMKKIESYKQTLKL
jgi:hypothetical protein